MSRKTLVYLALTMAILLTILCIVAVGASAIIEVRDNLTVLEAVYLQLWLGSRETLLNTAVGSDTTPQLFVIAPGDTAGAVGQKLYAAGFISDPELFRNYVRYHGLDSQLEAGTYFLNQAQGIPEIALTLTDSSRASVIVRILEGWRREEIAQALDMAPLLGFSGADFLAVTGPGADVPPEFSAYTSLPEGASLEGFLYPETYYVPPDATATEFRDILLRTFMQRVGADIIAAAGDAGMTLYQIVTLASIVQREAVHPDEQPLIASVYRNRLDHGMNLDADPTVQYGIGYRDGSWWPPITQEDYRTAVSSYNTYLVAGLPPSPIANPSLSAIRAAAFPDTSPYFFFRARCAQDGYHVFAVTFDEHIANGYCP